MAAGERNGAVPLESAASRHARYFTERTPSSNLPLAGMTQTLPLSTDL
jgi:hypothetical protein